MGALPSATQHKEDLILVLTLIAEVLSGETLITPGGAVDADTAGGHEPFTWDGWLEQVVGEQAVSEAAAVEAAAG